jgi:hypothetical protein
MKKSALAVLGTACGAVGFAIGALVASSNGWGSHAVVGNIVNESDEVVQSAAVHFETCGGTGNAVVGELRPGASQRVHYSVCGEGGYVVEATFEDGRKIRGNEGYVEVGYVSTDRISSARITSTQSIYGHAL